MANFGTKNGKGKAMAALPVIILAGGIILEVSFAAAFIAFYLVQSGLGSKVSFAAFSIARAGVDDALVRIIRNKDFSGNYEIAVSGGQVVTVSVCKDFKIKSDLTCDMSAPNPSKTEIISSGELSGSNRRLKAEVSIDPVTAEVSIGSIGEIPL